MYQICILFFALHKLNITLENSILHFLVGTSQFCKIGIFGIAAD